MREIKFRAWDKICNCWFNQTNPQGNPLNKHYIDFDGWVWKRENINSKDSDKNDSLARKEFILEQFTGLQDKHGKDIYEGDILKGCNNKKYGGDGTFPTKEMVVVFKNGYFGNGGMTLNKIMNDSCTPNTVEVIGNIHKDKNLITNK